MFCIIQQIFLKEGQQDKPGLNDFGVRTKNYPDVTVVENSHLLPEAYFYWDLFLMVVVSETIWDLV